MAAKKENFHPEQKFAGDKAYIGEPQIKTPHKKPKKQELTELQKEENKEALHNHGMMSIVAEVLNLDYKLFSVMCKK